MITGMRSWRQPVKGWVEAGKRPGDVAYKIPVWENLCVIFRFWNSDEEFPAQLQFLCDRNMLDFMHYETVWFLVSHIIQLLKQDLTGYPPSVVL